MYGRPCVESNTLQEIRCLLERVSNIEVQQAIDLAFSGIHKRSSCGDADRAARRCLHRLRTILLTEQHPVALDMPCKYSSDFVCRPGGLDPDELELARLMCPGVPYKQLCSKMSAIRQSTAGKSGHRKRALPELRCHGCGAREADMRYVESSADTVCTLCGIVCARNDFHVGYTHPDTPPALSEPIRGLQGPQRKADFLAGMCSSSHAVSAVTIDCDISSAESEIYEACNRHQLGLRTQQRACELYATYRKSVGHVQHRPLAILGCIILGRRISI